MEFEISCIMTFLRDVDGDLFLKLRGDGSKQTQSEKEE